MKKQLARILLAAMCLSLAACAPTPAPDAGTDAPETAAPAVSATETETAAPADPLDKIGTYDFDGAEFTMYTRYTQLFYPKLDVTETSGDLLDEAVYLRNRKLEERYGFKFRETAYYNTVEGNDAPRRLLASGDATYKLITGRYLNMFHYAAEGYFTPVTELAKIDVNEPYWSAEMYETLSLAGKHFFAAGDFNISAYDFTHVLLFNKEMAHAQSLPDLYALVDEGKWTFDRFYEMSAAATKDANGDGAMDGSDRYGYTARPSAVLPAFWVAAGAEPVKKNADAHAEFTAASDEDFLALYESVLAHLRDTGVWYVSPDGAAGDSVPSDLFRAGGALFLDAKLYEVNALRDCDVEFGILPYPKATEEQKSYRARMEGCELFGVPLTNTEHEMTGVILEAMACESRASVIPEYKEKMLKYRATRDRESSAVLDLVFANLVFDYGDTLLGGDFRDGLMNRCFQQNQRNIVSLLKKSTQPYQKTLDTFNTAFAALKQ